MDRTTFLCCLSALRFSLAAARASHIVVGSKNFTEQVILGEIIAQHIEARTHQPVERKLNLGGMLLAHQALLAKHIDMYPEYTGTALHQYFEEQRRHRSRHRAGTGARRIFSGIHLEWLDPLGFENSFAMTVRGEDARARHLETLSDAAADPMGFTLGAATNS